MLHGENVVFTTVSLTAAHTSKGETVFLCDTAGGAFTLTLSSRDINIPGKMFYVVDSGGVSLTTGAITIATEGAETINGGATATINVNKQALVLVSNGSNLFIAGEFDGAEA